MSFRAPRIAFAVAIALATAATLTVPGARLARADEPSATERARAIADQAKPLAQQGAETGDHGKLTEAIDLYKQAYALDPNPAYQCNAGVALRLVGELARAQPMLAECVARYRGAASARDVFRGQLADVEAALATSHVAVDIVTAPAGAAVGASTLADDEHVTAPGLLWLPPGTHTLTTRLAGYVTATTTVEISADEVAAGAKRRVRIDLVAETPTPQVVERVVEKPVTRGTGKRTAGWIAVIGGGALIAGGGVMHWVSYQTRDELAQLSGAAYDTKLETFQTQRNLTYGLYGLGAAAAITGGVLLYLAPRAAERVAIGPAPAGDGAMVWLDLGSWGGATAR
ncbi:MAG: hypothetical protein H6709_13035 [Kofleriaceae bacterium]|nr:hypothetical protein [Myxococcales bacterium]MCB9561613.1 hypothetical protein [Kofleriaceae bacterium]MCB9573001.1 hypothetical protein [Kofleriaceae bacterium]